MTTFEGGVLLVDSGLSVTLDEDPSLFEPNEASRIVVGDTSTGTLIVSSGAELVLTENDGQFLIGAGFLGIGTVTITGVSAEDRSTIDISRTGNPGATPFLAVGASGIGVLNIEDHSLLRTQSASIGLNQGSLGTVNLNDAGWVAFQIAIGDGGTGELNITNLAALESQDSVIGNSSTGNGEVTIDHAFWKLNGTFAVGRDGGQGSLEILNGGALTFTRPGSWDFTIGFSGGTGTVLVSGAGSKLVVNEQSNFIHIGSTGAGELNVANQGIVETTLLLMGDGGDNTAVATAESGGAILVGNRVALDSARLDVMDGGRMVIGQAPEISGAVRVGGEGRLEGEGLINGNLVNDGIVDGTFVFLGDVANTVVNNGIMIGMVRLGDGNDSFKGNGDTRAKVFGEDGRDTLSGSAHADLLYGDDGNDTLTGRAGTDTLTGGADRDRFDFNSLKDSVKGSKRDKIMDFQRGQDDIDLKDIDAKTSVAGNNAFKFIGKQGFHDQKGELRYIDKGASCIVQGDVNGDGKADFEIFVKVGALAKGDFLL